MERTTLTEDILVHCITADSFPECVREAHEKLHALIPFNPARKYFGLSWQEDDKIIYKAAAAALEPGELAMHNLEIKLLAKGDYLYIDVPDFMNDVPAIGAAFQELIHRNDIADNGFCIEWYMDNNLCRCMVHAK